MAASRGVLISLFLLFVSSSTNGMAERVDQTSSVLRDWKTTDVIGLRNFGPSAINWYDNAQLPAVFPSPDGLYFYLISSRGDLSCDCELQMLEVFDSRKIQSWLVGAIVQTPQPVISVTMRTREGVGNAFQVVSWAGDSKAVIITGQDERDRRQIYRLLVPAGKLQPLTDDPFAKDSRQVSGDVVMYRRIIPAPSTASTPYPVLPVSRDANGEAFIPYNNTRDTSQWVAIYRGREPWVLPFDRPTLPSGTVWFAPTRPSAVMLLDEDSLPPDDLLTTAELERAKSGMVAKSRQFILLNFETREMKPLTGVGIRGELNADAPNQPAALWSEHGTQLVLVNAALPTGHPSKKDSSYVLAFTPRTGKWQVLEPLSDAGQQVREVGWLTPGKDLLITHERDGKPAQGSLYKLAGERWVAQAVQADVKLPVPKKPALPPGLTVSVRQSANDPPVVVASNGHRERALSSPDPALHGIWIAKERPFAWREGDGRTVTGGLTLPRSARPQDKLPLVIQAYHYWPNIFAPEGPYGTAYARQSLAARGFAVLSIDILDIPGHNTPNEGEDFVARIDAAVDQLSRQGVIDTKRIGLVGYSRAGFMTFYALTHPGRFALAAAEVADSTTFSFPQYLSSTILGVPHLSYDRMYGGDFWRARNSWLDRDVIFNSPRLRAPTLFIATHTTGRTMAETEPSTVANISALKLNRRPFEYLFFPKGGHPLWRPRERLASIEATVDWMAYWLQNYEDPAPEKAGQYKRWRQIRNSNEESRAASDSGALGKK